MPSPARTSSSSSHRRRKIQRKKSFYIISYFDAGALYYDNAMGNFGGGVVIAHSFVRSFVHTLIYANQFMKCIRKKVSAAAAMKQWRWRTAIKTRTFT